MTEVAIKLVPGFRDHILMALHFVSAYLKCIENGIVLGNEDIELPAADAFTHITDAQEVSALTQRFLATEEGDTVKPTDRESILLHACFVLMSYALVTPVGEMICAEILSHMPPGHPLSDFKEFRKHNLVVNAHLIESAVENLDEIPEFSDMQEALQALSNK